MPRIVMLEFKSLHFPSWSSTVYFEVDTPFTKDSHEHSFLHEANDKVKAKTDDKMKSFFMKIIFKIK